MKITLILAQCISQHLQYSVQTICKVLEELDVNVHKIELSKLPYFEGKKNKEMDKVVQAIGESKGVIAISAVPMLGMHGAMQSFFDFATVYDASNFEKPMLAVTYSEWLGECEAAGMILRCWSILGGIDGGKFCLNHQVDVQQIGEGLEREIEDFYRLVKQERVSIMSTERHIFNSMKPIGVERTPKPEKETQMKSFVDVLKSENKIYQEKPVGPALEPNNAGEPIKGTQINLSTKEQTIKEIASLLKKEVDSDFKSISSGVYARPQQFSQSPTKKIQQIPHYFIAQHDKTLALDLKYHITDLNEEGYIVIQNGDCLFQDNLDRPPTVELILNEEALQGILSKKITYQKAFMLGKLKVKGNFAILPKLDQIFRAL